MAKKNQKHEHKQESEHPTPQPTAPTTPLELSEEELEQVVGGVSSYQQPSSTSLGGFPDCPHN